MEEEHTVEELLTGDEVAERLKTTPRFVRRLVAERRIEYVKVGRLVRFSPGAVAEYIERNKVVPIDRTKVRRYLREVA
jgi:excisionase family DNA binding protein